ncbi:hypothetical protein ENBRE01_1836 [Enteropsectra breve]|nr:hypothetical protein ENBRE01_1836 [Enteropsectra breve]
MNDSRIYFIDEVGFSVSMRTKSGRSLRDTTPVYVVPQLRSRNISICAAINKDQIVGYKANVKANKGESFKEFVIEPIDDLISNGMYSGVFVMDNALIHKIEAIGTYAQEHGFDIVFLLPYSPFLNPIENLFSMWKQAVRSANSETEEELMANIITAASYISTEDRNNYYRHMFAYIT